MDSDLHKALALCQSSLTGCVDGQQGELLSTGKQREGGKSAAGVDGLVGDGGACPTRTGIPSTSCQRLLELFLTRLRRKLLLTARYQRGLACLSDSEQENDRGIDPSHYPYFLNLGGFMEYYCTDDHRKIID